MEIRAQAGRDSGTSLKLFGFIAESLFTFIPESCSRSPRNSVRDHPGIAFTSPRIPQFLHEWFKAVLTKLSRKSETAAALSYALAIARTIGLKSTTTPLNGRCVPSH
jgi:hypothetical protein